MLQKLMIIIALIIFALLYSCNMKSERESTLLKSLEKKYAEYLFSSYDVYLKVFTSGNIDTSEVIKIYMSEIVMEDSVVEGKYFFNPDIPWKYLNVYKKSTFIFQISMDLYDSSDIYISKREYY